MRLLRLLLAASLSRHSRSLAPQTKPAPAALDHTSQRRIAELREQRNAIDAELAALEDERRRPITPKRQIKALYAAFNARDAPAVADLLADDVVYEDLLLGASTICRGKAAFAGALRFHPAFVSSQLGLPMGRLELVVDDVACDGARSVGVEWHVEIDGRPFPLSRGLSLATLDADGKLSRVVDIAEAPWRVVGLLVRPVLGAFGVLGAALGFGAVPM
mmetsp:Transcript_5584/g.16443  ORF Transcript_5584/g.16443 Transcript_5584/m.16443 type:complete len:218 (-) Transcript_5584:22-675(-)